MNRLILSAAALPFACAAVPAAACSVREGYRVPTSLELAERADTIILGKVEADADRDISVRPTMLIKGAALPGRIDLRGSLSDGRMQATPSDPKELAEPHPESLRGACTRYTFDEGMTLLLFLERGEDGELHAASYPFARVAEDVPSPDARWVKAVRIYAEIAALPESERRAALEARRDALRTGDADARAIAADIDRQLATTDQGGR